VLYDEIGKNSSETAPVGTGSVLSKIPWLQDDIDDCQEVVECRPENGAATNITEEHRRKNSEQYRKAYIDDIEYTEACRNPPRETPLSPDIVRETYELLLGE